MDAQTLQTRVLGPAQDAPTDEDELSNYGSPAGGDVNTQVALPSFGSPSSSSGSQAPLPDFNHPDATIAQVGSDYMGRSRNYDDPATQQAIDYAMHPEQYGGDPSKPSWWRQILAGVASMTPARGFAPDIAYGWQGAHNLAEYQQNLGRLNEASQLELHQRQLDEEEQLRQAQMQSTNLYRQSILGPRDATNQARIDSNAWNARRGQENYAGLNAQPTPMSPEQQVPTGTTPGGVPLPSLAVPSGAIPTPGYRQTYLPPAPGTPGMQVETPPPPPTPTITPEVANSDVGRKLGLTAGQPVPPQYADMIARAVTAQPKTENDFEQFYKQYITDNKLPDNSASRLMAKAKYTAAGQQPERPQRALMIGPDGKVIEVQPGMTVPTGSRTPTQQGQLNTPTTQQRNVGTQAELVHEQMPQLMADIDRLTPKLGPVMGRWNDFMQGKVGADDPEFAGLRANLLMASSAVALAHARGRLPENLREEFNRYINNPKQTPANLKAGLQVIDNWMMRNMAVTGTSAAPAPTGGSNIRTYNPATGKLE